MPWIRDHLGSNQVSRVIYGAIIGLALVVALEHDPPRPAVMVGTLVGTGVAVGLAELYSEVVGTEVLLSAVGAMEVETAFDLAKWSGLALTGFYGFCAARFSGLGLVGALAQAAAVAGIGGCLIGLKALVH